MGLTTGTRLGPYEILSALGAGGMGEVYRARDTKLGRDVALKVIPDTFAPDPERLARFQREAEVLATLNHPHIAAIDGHFERRRRVQATVADRGRAQLEGRTGEVTTRPRLGRCSRSSSGSIRAPDGDREGATDLAHLRRAHVSHSPGQPGLLDGLHVIEVDG